MALCLSLWCSPPQDGGTLHSTRFYTVLPSYDVFTALLEYMQPLVEKLHQTSSGTEGRKRSLTYGEELLAVLMRLRLGLLLEDIANRFVVHPSTVSSVFATWIRILAVEMRKIFLWPSKETVRARNPVSFKKYLNTCIIIDCSDLFIQRPSSLQRGINPAEILINFAEYFWSKFLALVLYSKKIVASAASSCPT